MYIMYIRQDPEVLPGLSMSVWTMLMVIVMMMIIIIIMLFVYDLGQPQSLNPKPRAKPSSLIVLFHT